MAEYIERDGLEFPYMTMTLWGLNKETCHAYNEGIKAAADYIASIPAADVAPVVHGRWIEKQEPLSWCEDDVDLFWECSVCGVRTCGESPYCPNCGARMDGE